MVISIHPRHLAQLLEDGRYRTQFETGHSGGSYDPDHRRSVERRFGVPQSEDIDVLRPTYGSLVPLPGLHGDAKGPVQYQFLPGACYGEATVVLRERVRGRGTLTFGDSFGGQWGLPLTGEYSDDQLLAALRTPSWMDESRHSALMEALGTVGYDEGREQSYARMLEREFAGSSIYNQSIVGIPVTSEMRAAANSWGTYAEMQVHGGVTLHDIAAIHIITRNTGGAPSGWREIEEREHREKLEALASRLGIPLVWVNPTDTMGDLPRR
jgi:hypothetical protein